MAKVKLIFDLDEASDEQKYLQMSAGPDLGLVLIDLLKDMRQVIKYGPTVETTSKEAAEIWRDRVTCLLRDNGVDLNRLFP